MRQIILFILTFILVFIIYQILLVGKRKKRNKKQPIEVKYLETKYNLDLKKINYKKLLRTISVVSSLDISIIITIAFLFPTYLIELVVALVLIVPVIMISYSFVGKYYIKKGMRKNE